MWIIRPFNYYSFWSHNTHNLKNLRWVISFLTLYLVERRFACFQPCSDMPAVKSFCIFFRYISNRNKMAWPKQLREGFTWIFISREMWAHHHQGREEWCLKELRKSSHIETPAWKKKSKLGMVWAYETSKPPSYRIIHFYPKVMVSPSSSIIISWKLSLLTCIFNALIFYSPGFSPDVGQKPPGYWHK